MTQAEEGLPPRPLTGSILLASTDQPADLPADEAPQQQDQKSRPDTFERLLNGLFGG
jgi:hypothetical protein